MSGSKYIEETQPPEQDFESGIVHFDVSGRFICKLARDLWIEGNEAKAINMLTEGFNDLSEDIAVSILTGKKLLSGWNSHLELIDDDEPMSSVEEAIENKNKKYESVKQDYLDLKTTCEKEVFGILKKFRTSTEYDDIVELLDMDIPRFSYDNEKSIKDNFAKYNETIAEAEQHIKNIVNGINRYTELLQEVRETRERQAEASRKNTEEIKERLKSVALSSVPPNMNKEEKEFWEDRMKRSIDAMHTDAEITNDTKFDFDSGWLSPKGFYYGCLSFKHIATAELLAEKTYPDDNKEANAERLLEKKGWMKCSSQIWYDTANMTIDQLLTIQLWAKKWGEPISWNTARVKKTIKELKEEYKL